MKRDERFRLYEAVVAAFGRGAQFDMVCEEAAELTVEVFHTKRGRGSTAGLASEVADVRIMLEQLEVMVPGLSALADEAMGEKLDRLAGRLEAHNLRAKQGTP